MKGIRSLLKLVLQLFMEKNSLQIIVLYVLFKLITLVWGVKHGPEEGRHFELFFVEF